MLHPVYYEISVLQGSGKKFPFQDNRIERVIWMSSRNSEIAYLNLLELNFLTRDVDGSAADKSFWRLGSSWLSMVGSSLTVAAQPVLSVCVDLVAETPKNLCYAVHLH